MPISQSRAARDNNDLAHSNIASAFESSHRAQLIETNWQIAWPLASDLPIDRHLFHGRAMNHDEYATPLGPVFSTRELNNSTQFI
jgi:hypothetical protein